MVKVDFEAGIKQKRQQQQKLISSLDQRSLEPGMEAKIKLHWDNAVSLARTHRRMRTEILRN